MLNNISSVLLVLSGVLFTNSPYYGTVPALNSSNQLIMSETLLCSNNMIIAAFALLVAPNRARTEVEREEIDRKQIEKGEAERGGRLKAESSINATLNEV